MVEELFNCFLPFNLFFLGGGGASLLQDRGNPKKIEVFLFKSKENRGFPIKIQREEVFLLTSRENSGFPIKIRREWRFSS